MDAALAVALGALFASSLARGDEPVERVAARRRPDGAAGAAPPRAAGGVRRDRGCSPSCSGWRRSRPRPTRRCWSRIYSVAAYERRRWGPWLALAILELGVLLAALSFDESDDSLLAAFLTLSAFVVAAYAMGVYVRTRREHIAALTERALQLERERDQQAPARRRRRARPDRARDARRRRAQPVGDDRARRRRAADRQEPGRGRAGDGRGVGHRARGAGRDAPAARRAARAQPTRRSPRSRGSTSSTRWSSRCAAPGCATRLTRTGNARAAEPGRPARGLPARAGGADQHAQARARRVRGRGPPALRRRRALARGRRRRGARATPARAGTASPGCASAPRPTARPSTPARAATAAGASVPASRWRDDPRPARRRPGAAAHRLSHGARGPGRDRRSSARPATATRRSS